ncbi:MAG: FTR1 family iron permease [Candidatus Hodarchaeales archaeon]|jgi:high-affinity iron transporter
MATGEIISLITYSIVVSLREVLEAALIIGIVAGYLTKLNRRELFRDVILGIISAIIFSIVMAFVFLTIFEGLIGYQELFEGLIMFIAAGVLTWMIIWMMKQSKGLRTEFEDKIDNVITNQEKLGIVLLVFFAVAREGAELVLFLYASYVGNVNQVGSLESILGISSGFVVGLALASILALLLFSSTRKLKLRAFFRLTSLILIVFAAGLIAHGIHEVYEFLEGSGTELASLFFWTETWNVNNTPLGDLLYFLFGWTYDIAYPGRFEKSIVGSILSGLLGWNDNPALIEVIAYITYYIVILAALKFMKTDKTDNLELDTATA